MSRRNKTTKPGQKFAHDEVEAIHNAIAKLYRRTVYHLVSPRFPRDPLPQVWRSFIPEDDWAFMARAQSMMVTPTNTWSFYDFDEAVSIPSTPCLIKITTRRLIPSAARAHLPDPVVPQAIVDFAVAATKVREQWRGVYNVFTDLCLADKCTRRTAAYHWPCAGALLTLAGRPRDDLETVRPGAIAGGLAVKCRETSSFVMQHMLLPPIDSTLIDVYEGDPETGLAGRIAFNLTDTILGDAIWPLSD